MRHRGLIIGDDAVATELIALAVGDERFDVVVATTVAEALDLLAPGSFSIVLADAKMGLPQLTALMTGVARSGAKCVFVAEDADEMLRLEAEGIPYLAKPLRLPEISDLLHRFVC
jgi:DNA-binding response OmpR family regulator